MWFDVVYRTDTCITSLSGFLCVFAIVHHLVTVTARTCAHTKVKGQNLWLNAVYMCTRVQNVTSECTVCVHFNCTYVECNICTFVNTYICTKYV